MLAMRIKQQPICPACGSAQILYRSMVRSFLCRRCGWEGIREALEWLTRPNH